MDPERLGDLNNNVICPTLHPDVTIDTCTNVFQHERITEINLTMELEIPSPEPVIVR